MVGISRPSLASKRAACFKVLVPGVVFFHGECVCADVNGEYRLFVAFDTRSNGL